MAAQFLLNEVVLQPTSLCNLNCTYCYLPQRRQARAMLPQVTVALAQAIAKFPVRPQPIRILWHCGEPLACGHPHFTELIAPFEPLERSGCVQHAIQTNATLIDQRWCDFFLEHAFDVGVSLDGPEAINRNRVNWNERPAFAQTLRGIERLKDAGIGLNIIAVVSHEALDRAQEMYQFFVDLDCQGLSINIEEYTGVNTQRNVLDDTLRVRQFWTDLAAAWRAQPVITIREFYWMSRWWASVHQEGRQQQLDELCQTNLFPTIGWNGDIVFLSPELLDTPTAYYHSFVVGNICQESFPKIVNRAKTATYVLDFVAGREACRKTCNYFSFCGGGYASSKFFELGTTAGTETVCCRNSRQQLFEAFYPVMLA